MVTAVVLAGTIVLGAQARWVALAALALWHPMIFVVVAAAMTGHAALGRRRRAAGPESEARFLEVVSTELGAGRSLRLAVVAAAEAVPEVDGSHAARLAVAGWPADRVGGELARALQLNGATAGAAFSMAARTGASVRTVFATLAGLARERAEAARERRASTAQARLSAWLVGGAPLALVALSLALGGTDLLATPAGVAIAVIGLGLELAGAVTVWWMLRREAAW